MKKTILTLIFALIFTVSYSQGKYKNKAFKVGIESIDEFREFLSIPNDANYKDEMEPLINWGIEKFKYFDFEVKRLETKGLPLLLASKIVSEESKTLLIYLQFDGQPVDNSKWNQEDPYKAELKTLRNGKYEKTDWRILDKLTSNNINEEDIRIFARSASDAKGPIMMILNAFKIMKQNNLNLNYNLKIIMDFEEEKSSPNLADAVKKYATSLKSDALLIFDGPKHPSNLPTLTFGARGISDITLITYGPIVPQHSGHFGNYAPNPVFRMSEILSSMKDKNGRVTINGFYDGITLDEETIKVLNQVPDDEKGMRESMQFKTPDNVGSSYQESIQYPSLNIRGMRSGWINEEVRTIIPSWARAEIDVRLVKESDPRGLLSLIKRHIESLGYLVLDREPNKSERLKNKKIATFTSKVSYQSFRTSLKSKYSVWLRDAIKKGFGEDPILIRMSGGSIPISPFVNTLNIPAITVPTVNRDNNQHSPNENIRLGNYRDGIKTILSILLEKL